MCWPRSAMPAPRWRSPCCHLSGFPRGAYYKPQKDSWPPSPLMLSAAEGQGARVSHSMPFSSCVAEDVGGSKDQRASTYYLHHRDQPVRAEVAVANGSDQYQFKGHDHICNQQSSVQIADQERQRVQRAAKKSHNAGDRPANDRATTPRQLSCIGERL